MAPRKKTKTVEVVDMRDSIPPIEVPVPSLDGTNEDEAVQGEVITYTDSEMVFTDANGDRQTIPLTEEDVSDFNIEKRRLYATALKLSGATYKAIAAQLQISVQVAMSDVKAGLQGIDADGLYMLRSIHHQRLETLLQMVWKGALKGDIASVNTAMGVLDRIDRLFGLSDQTITHEDEANINGGVLVAGGSTGDYRKALQAARRGKGGGGPV